MIPQVELLATTAVPVDSRQPNELTREIERIVMKSIRQLQSCVISGYGIVTV